VLQLRWIFNRYLTGASALLECSLWRLRSGFWVNNFKTLKEFPYTLWSIKKRDTFIFSITLANIDGFSYFFTSIFSKELLNKNLLKFSPHLKSVAALPCETWNVKWVDIQQRHIQFKTDAKCQVTVEHLVQVCFTSGIQNGRLLLAHRRWVAHATDLLLHLWRFVQCCATYSTGADTARRRHLRVSRRPAVVLQPRSCNTRHGIHIWAVWGPLVGRNEVWTLACLGVKVRLCHVPCAQTCWNMKLSPDISLMNGNSFSFSSTSR